MILARTTCLLWRQGKRPRNTKCAHDKFLGRLNGGRASRRRTSVRSETSSWKIRCLWQEVCGDTPARGEAASTQATRCGGERHVRLTCASASVGSASSAARYLVQFGVPLWLPRRQSWAAGTWPPRRRWQGNGPLEVKVEIVVVQVIDDNGKTMFQAQVRHIAWGVGLPQVREPTSRDPFETVEEIQEGREHCHGHAARRWAL